jgi:hypothetical protein
MTRCAKCTEGTEPWCKLHEACGRSVRARWMWARRDGFKAWRSGPGSQQGGTGGDRPTFRETTSQFEARVRGDDD